MFKKGVIVFAGVVLLAGVGLFIMCNPSSSSKASTVSRLKVLDGEASGWTIDNANTGIWTPESWRSPGPMDGYVDGYSSSYGITFSEVLDETMNGPSPESVRIFVIDYTNAATATAMFNNKKTGEWVSNLDPLTPTFSDTTAIGEYSHGSIWVCAHFKQFYIELRLLNAPDFAQSKTDALMLLGIFEAKINGL